MDGGVVMGNVTTKCGTESRHMRRINAKEEDGYKGVRAKE